MMAFWSSRPLRERILEERLIVPYDPARVNPCVYEMGVGREGYITSVSKGKTRVPPDERIIIPPGQFGLLTTREAVKVPVDVARMSNLPIDTSSDCFVAMAFSAGSRDSDAAGPLNNHG
jgi:deoxycytidine triphosphate deaminase